MNQQETTNKKASLFTRFARTTSAVTGRPATFILAVLVVIVWAFSGPFFNYSDTWQLVINTGTTVVTFLMVFLIQNTQNRDSMAVQLKLDELIRSIKEASNEFVDLEERDERDLKSKHEEMLQKVKQAEKTMDEASDTLRDASEAVAKRDSKD